MTKQEAKIQIEKLVHYFESDTENQNIDEATARRQFISPLFQALGWDVYNTEQQLPQSEKLVKVEEGIKIGEHTKNPDYTFHLTPNERVFFLEAKRPNVNLQTDIKSAYQIRNYGWNSYLCISVLTNFKEFAIYNTRNIEPQPLDQPNRGRLEYLKYTDYLDRFDDIWDIFAYENVLNGSIEQYAIQKNIIADVAIKGSMSVDQAFLRDIEDWRQILAKEIILRQENISKEDLNYSVQKIIDRIIFLRIAEDRNLETFGNLKQVSNNYEKLCKHFQNADKRYNSGLFHFTNEKGRGTPDTITPTLRITDAPIHDIIKRLYNGKYIFDVMPAYILGSVYERFLGKEVVLEKKNATITEKPEVRKAGGVYYTPEYIVKYIVENAIQKKNISSTCHAEFISASPRSADDVSSNKGMPKQVRHDNTGVRHDNVFRILDPACGSGSFLLVAYQFMLNYYERKKKDKLNINERKQILLDHIYGVDIDEQAVEVTKLSLLLKVIEDLTDADIKILCKSQHILPSLHNNIKCGNSLIDDESIAGEKAFVWEKEFAEVFCRDTASRVRETSMQTISSNIKNKHTDTAEKHTDTAEKHTDTAEKHTDTAEKHTDTASRVPTSSISGFDVVIGNPPYVAIKSINKDNLLYYNEKYETGKGQSDLYSLFIERGINLLNNKGNISFIVPDSINDRSNYITTRKLLVKNTFLQKIMTLNNVFSDANVGSTIFVSGKRKNNKVSLNKTKDLLTLNNKIIQKKETTLEKIINNENYNFLFIDEKETDILDKVFLHKRLSELSFLGRGEELSKKSNIIKQNKTSKTLSFITGSDFGRYFIKDIKNFINQEDIKKNIQKLYCEKIIVRQVGNNITATLDLMKCVTPQSVYTIVPNKEINIKYLLALLNSKLFDFIYIKKYKTKEIFPRILLENLKSLPIVFPDKKSQEEIINLVNKILKLKTENKDTTDLENEIDNIVYKLYDLNEEEISYICKK